MSSKKRDELGDFGGDWDYGDLDNEEEGAGDWWLDQHEDREYRENLQPDWDDDLGEDDEGSDDWWMIQREDRATRENLQADLDDGNSGGDDFWLSQLRDRQARSEFRFRVQPGDGLDTTGRTWRDWAAPQSSLGKNLAQRMHGNNRRWEGSGRYSQYSPLRQGLSSRRSRGFLDEELLEGGRDSGSRWEHDRRRARGRDNEALEDYLGDYGLWRGEKRPKAKKEKPIEDTLSLGGRST